MKERECGGLEQRVKQVEEDMDEIKPKIDKHAEFIARLEGGIGLLITGVALVGTAVGIVAFFSKN